MNLNSKNMNIQDIQKTLSDDLISCDVYEWENGVYVEIEYGDWKHDHLRCDYLMKTMGYSLIEEKVTKQDGSDCYGSIHIYEKGGLMKLNDIRNVLRHGKLYWKFSWVKDYGNGTKLIEYKSFKSARGKKHISILQIGYRVNDFGVISCGYTKDEEHKEIIFISDLEGLA